MKQRVKKMYNQGRLKRRRFVKLSSLFKRFEIEVSSSVQAVKTM